MIAYNLSGVLLENGNEILSSKGAAALLGISVKTLHRYRRGHRLPAHRMPGGRYYFLKQELWKWIKNRTD